MKFVRIAFGIISLLLLIGIPLALYINGLGNEKMSVNYVRQDNHTEVVRLKKEAVTCIRLEAKWDQTWNLKSCDDYELVTIQKVKMPHYMTKKIVDGVEIWLNVKQPFLLVLSYQDPDGNDKFLYTKVDFEK